MCYCAWLTKTNVGSREVVTGGGGDRSGESITNTPVTTPN